MERPKELRISVRDLVEFVLRHGDLDTRFTGTSRALEGTRAHQKIQKSKTKEYLSEVVLVHTVEYKGVVIRVEGRADGIISEPERVIIDEIKTTTRPLSAIDEDFNILHWAQAKCYAYIYALQNNLKEIFVQLTYYHLETEELKYLLKKFTISELENFFDEMIDKYYYWANLIRQWQIIRDSMIKDVLFPFKEYRKGQRELAVATYKTIVHGKKILAQAPTGIGKTISTLFPSIKSIGEGYSSKIFYLTAKTITRQVAVEASIRLKENGLRLKTLVLTAKEKICFNNEVSCNPEQCEYARGHFDRVNTALKDIFTEEDIITKDVIDNYASKHKVCPFEFSLDLALWADCVICDYNYVFDPRVYLKRFFNDTKEDFVFLIDEAHNLVDRSREMFSAELFKSPFLKLKKVFKELDAKISKTLNKVNTFMVGMKKLCEVQSYYITKDEPKELYPLLRKLVTECEAWLLENERSEVYDELLEIYFNVLQFLRIAELYDRRYITYIEKIMDDVKIKIFCIDPSMLLGEALKRGRSAVLFSATLTPIRYFKEILGCTEDDYSTRLKSPFSRENLCLMIADNVSTTFKTRENSYEKIADYIKAVISAKKGNYLIFFPSYKYMKDVFEIFSNRNPDIYVLEQRNNMNEDEREEFLKRFDINNDKTMVAFAVMGGIFSEGIDLVGDRLIGSIIVGVGLPQICLERDIIREYFDDKNNLGYEYAYMFPGMNKVLQASGRVIRSESDKGVVLLIDERFMSESYRRLFPEEWNNSIRIRELGEVTNILRDFWKDK